MTESSLIDNRLRSFYAGKTVLVTGNTGFKGSWLCAWLNQLGARVVGFALDPPSQPNIFEAARLTRHVDYRRGDVRNFDEVSRCVSAVRPHVVFHLAAQSLVRPSYDDPCATIDVNVIGTANVLNAASRCDSVISIVSITSDKCYRNQDWIWGYREDDELGGYDPYSASKASAELVVRCFSDARYQRAAGIGRRVPIASARAGNVIGGGDWAVDRVIPDIVRAIARKEDIVVRNPAATRPWQHVLEPLSGYLWLAVKLAEDADRFGGGWNFGPRDQDPWTVADVVAELLRQWRPPGTSMRIEQDATGAESKLLRLDCSKASEYLGWHATWTVSEALGAIVRWYRHYFDNPGVDMYPLLVEQIGTFTQRARELGLTWAAAAQGGQTKK